MLRIFALTCFVALFAITPGLAGTSLAEGTYQGTGNWEGNDGTTGTYQVETTVLGTTVRSVYTFEVQGRQQQQTATMTLTPDGQGGWQVFDDKTALIGGASCLADQCLLTIEEGPVKVLEVIRAREGRFDSFGTKTGPGFSIVYSSTLNRR